MDFPDLLYVPRGSDVLKSIINPQRVLRRSVVDGTFATIGVNSLPVPLDMVFALNHVQIRGGGGGGQTVNIVRVEVLDNGSLVSELFQNQSVGTAEFDQSFSFPGSIILMPNENLRAFMTFSAGVQSNFTELHWHGVMFPRSNWQRGTM